MPDKKVDTIGAAIARAQLTIKKAEKSSDNPYFKSKYAGLEEIIAVTRDALNKEGIAVLQVCDFHSRAYRAYRRWEEGALPSARFHHHQAGVWGSGSAVQYAPAFSEGGHAVSR